MSHQFLFNHTSHCKPLNDIEGHKAGDKFLKLIAKELTSLGRQSDIAFRIGGDEFAVIFEGNQEDQLSLIKQQISQILCNVSRLLKFEVDASVGFALLSQSNRNVNKWVQQADANMYKHKHSK